jgi:hypothetical protein
VLTAPERTAALAPCTQRVARPKDFFISTMRVEAIS